MFAALAAFVLIVSSPGVLPLAEKPPMERKAVDAPATVETPPSGIRVQLECVAHADGRIGDCVVLNETRPGLGFGDAAIALMNGSPVGPDIQMGRASEVKFRHTIQFTPD